MQGAEEDNPSQVINHSDTQKPMSVSPLTDLATLSPL